MNKYALNLVSLLLCHWLLMATLSSAQTTSVGPVESWQRTEKGIEGKTRSAFFRITFYSDQVIRVRVSLQEEMDEFRNLPEIKELLRNSTDLTGDLHKLALKYMDEDKVSEALKALMLL